MTFVRVPLTALNALQRLHTQHRQPCCRVFGHTAQVPSQVQRAEGLRGSVQRVEGSPTRHALGKPENCLAAWRGHRSHMAWAQIVRARGVLSECGVVVDMQTCAVIEG